jgi:hypothetical protein
MGGRVEYSADVPLLDPEKDQFARWPFAEAIAHALARRKDPSCVVVGINGGWGEGKTTVLNYISHALANESNTFTLSFNPWRFASEEVLLKSYYEALANRIDTALLTKLERGASGLSKFSRVIAKAWSKAGAVEALGELIGKVSTEELRRRIEERLQARAAQVVVLVDDIDRLDCSEVQAVFRLVKLNADIRWTAFVLAFDEGAVADVLATQYGVARPTAGKDFLDKIIQVPLRLPRVADQALRTFCFERIDVALKASGVDLTDDQVRTFVRYFNGGLEPQLVTPRAAVRYGNTLQFALPILLGEANPVDLLLVEGVRVFYPALYAAIAANGELLTGYADVGARADQKWQDQVKTTIDDATVGLGPRLKEAALHLMQFLFPRLQSVYGNVYHRRTEMDQWARDQRVCSDEYFERYFSYSVLPDDVPDTTMRDLLDAASTGEDAGGRIEELIAAGKSDALITKIGRQVDHLSPKAAQAIALSIAPFGAAFPRRGGFLGMGATWDRSGILLSRLVRLQSTDEDRATVGSAVLRAAEPLAFAAEVLRWLVLKHDREDPTDLSEEAVNRVRRIVVDHITAAVAEGNLSGICESEDLVHLLAEWRRLDGRAVVTEAVSAACGKDPSLSLSLLRSLRPHAVNLESGATHRGGLSRQHYDNLAFVVEPAILVEPLERELRRTLVAPSEYPEHDAITDDVMVSQFMWLHAQAKPSQQGDEDSEGDETNIAPDST